jgi:ribosomal-protein-alanine N-acetyltransferase
MIFFKGPRMDLAFRRLASADGAACADLHCASFAHGWSAEEFENLIASRSVHADGLCPEGKLGTKALAAFVLSRQAADEAEILSIAVDPARRGKGLARRLLDQHMQGLARAGAQSLFLEVDEGNSPALALYRRAGFEEVGRRKHYYAKPDGARSHALVLRARL